MRDQPQSIKTMKLYWQVERIHNELRALGFDDDGPLRVADLVPFDQYHYLGTETVDEALRALELGPESHVLDVGSGIGGPARYMAERGGCRVTALELQPDLNETAAELTRRCGLSGRVRHVCGDILGGDVDGPAFDALMSMLVFLHIPDRARLFGRCHDALKPGGAMFIDDFYKRAEPSPGEWADLADKVYCGYLPTLEEYRDQIRAAGFEKVRMADQSEPWTAFVRRRLREFRNDRERQISTHGAEIVEGLDDFYATVVRLFLRERLGGVRILAKRA